MNKIFYSIREFFWPILEKAEMSKDLKEIDENSILYKKKEDIDDLYDLTRKNIEEEEDRIKTIETKSIVFIGSIGLSISILSLFSKNIFEDNLNGLNIYHYILIFSYIVMLIYFIRVGYFCIKALERKAYHRISSVDYIKYDTFNKKKIISDMLNNISKNYVPINDKVDMMTMSQEYFKRAMMTLFLFIIILFGNILFNNNHIQISNAPINNYVNFNLDSVNFDFIKKKIFVNDSDSTKNIQLIDSLKNIYYKK